MSFSDRSGAFCAHAAAAIPPNRNSAPISPKHTLFIASPCAPHSIPIRRFEPGFPFSSAYANRHPTFLKFLRPYRRIMNDHTLMTVLPPAIRLESVSRQYTMGESVIRAVNDVCLTVPSGEFLALLGSSGSGKSTLLNLIAGLDRPSSGAVIAQGKNLSKMSSLELARYRRQTVGMVFQSFNLLPRMTLEENVELPLRLAEVDRSERAARVREALGRVGLDKRVGHRPSELSGGEQQRTAIARALVNRPKILLADEPTGNLDSTTGESILALLREIQKNPGMTIVMVTHERPLAERFADRLAVMGDGKLLSNGASR